MNPLRWSLVAALGVVVADQLTKWWVVATLPGDPIVVIDGVLELRYVTNPGAAFSLLPEWGSLIALAGIAIVIFIVVVARKVERTAEAVPMGLVLGGAVGNLLDRFFRGDGFLEGEVVDFVDFSFFPAFNVADAAITVGAGLVLVVAFFFSE